MDIEKLSNVLRKSWSKETRHPDFVKDWSKDNPAKGQCAVTAFIVQDYFGGKLAYNRMHFHIWNILPDGETIDLTKDQFPINIIIEQEGITSREEIEKIDPTVMERYKILKGKLLKILD